jgi:hypothetical protein
MLRGLAQSGKELLRVTEEERSTRNGHLAAIVTVPRDGRIAFELERVLFDRGLHVGVVDRIEEAQALRDAGLIAILRSHHTEVVLEIREICQSLEADGIIPGEGFTSGGGI